MSINFLIENYESVLQAIGGLGLLLLGIVVMTDSLRILAGAAMRSALMRFTHSPLSGALTGSITTTILQSSSATTAAAVGFVGAGLITYSESLGIIFGANIGSTVTGWIVVLLGFKLNLSSIMMLFVFIGVLLRLFAKKRLATFGYALAGFSLIFIGIATMQQGMSGFTNLITPEQLPSDTFIGRLQLISIGIIFTIITQASSAGVAVALSALFAGTINFEQAAALVIGMDVGTTVTAALATIGQSIEARRTGFSHVIYNILTAVGAVFLITPFTMVIGNFFPTAISENAEISLVAFHTTFNILGLMIILPFTNNFASLMTKLIPEKKSLYTNTLDTQLLEQPSMALTAVQNTVYTEIIALLSHINAILGDTQSKRADLVQLQKALDKTHTYIDKISLESESGVQWERLVAMIHTLDHMQRLHERCEEEENRAKTLRYNKHFTKEREIITLAIKSIIETMMSQQWHKMSKQAQMSKSALYKQLKPYRRMIVAKIARGEIDVQEGTDYLEGVRWLKRVSWHILRISFHYEEALLVAGK
ncbi:Na/Pi cotransporter family protein [Candidatus Sulfurimonas marisnigri]|uniref:Na/Pi cotransporter family protein n=1 Tax=Candidatus Sulfurimonas marisnigri TaxID=2740405 RepID=A0A7S7M0A2_9BACT|nr:Na/Pi symporter [Candidatus Sulfurimonas marisnigri]QOY54730.1 Na/Pi cotransporter family protein [Candidatus Sulfurimonas marisnigri]